MESKQAEGESAINSQKRLVRASNVDAGTKEREACDLLYGATRCHYPCLGSRLPSPNRRSTNCVSSCDEPYRLPTLKQLKYHKCPLTPALCRGPQCGQAPVADRILVPYRI